MNCPIHYDLLYLRRLVVWPAFDTFGQGGLCYVTVPVTTKQQHSSNFKCMLLGVYLSIKAKLQVHVAWCVFIDEGKDRTSQQQSAAVHR
jgi:hypothetical protein